MATWKSGKNIRHNKIKKTEITKFNIHYLPITIINGIFAKNKHNCYE